MLGMIAAALAVLTAKRLGYDWKGGEDGLRMAVWFFAGSIVLSAITMIEREEGWMIAGTIAQAIGGLALFFAVTAFKPSDEAASAES